jgi:hypothetical protein
MLLPLVLAACGGNVVVDDASATTTGAGGFVPTTTGAGGSVLTTTATTTSASVGAGGSTSATCSANAIIALVVDDAQPVSLTATCVSGVTVPPLPVPYGQERFGGTVDSGGLGIVGCVPSPTGNPSFSLFAAGAYMPGTFPVTNVDYVAADGSSEDQGGTSLGTLQVDELDPVGGTISGSFQVAIMPSPLQGKFVVCRAGDLIVPSATAAP